MVMVGRSSAWPMAKRGRTRPPAARPVLARKRRRATCFIGPPSTEGGDYAWRLLQLRSDGGGPIGVKPTPAEDPKIWHRSCSSRGGVWGRRMHLFTTRALLKGLLALALGAPPARQAFAQAYPSRPLRLVVPFSAGAGILDIMARILSQHLSPALGQQVV